MMRWELGNVKLHQMIDMKKMPKKGKVWYEKMPRKGKEWIEKDAQMGKDCDEKDEKWFTYY